MQNNIKKDYLWNTIGVFAQNAISPLLLIAITRINGIYDSGLFSFAFSLAIIFWALGMWSGRTYQASDIRQDFAHRSYIMARLILAVVMLVGAAAFSFASNYDTAKTSIILVLVLFKAVESIADALYGILQVHGHLYISGKSLLYKAVGGFGVFIAIDLLTKNILLGSVGIVLVNLLVVFFYDIRNTKKLEDIHIKLAQVKHYAKNSIVILKRSSPVFAVLFLSMFSLNIPRYYIDQYHPEQLGYFGILAMPITLIALLMTFVLQPNVVHLSTFYEQRKYHEFHKTISKLVYITVYSGLLILLAAYVAGSPVLELVFGVNFSSYKASLMIIVAGGIINALVSILINILIIMRRFKYQFYILLTTNATLVVFSAIFVKQYGLLGGVILFVSVNIVQVLLLAMVYSRTLQRARGAIS